MLGSSGAHARIPVEWEHREDCAHATILNRPMGDVSALGRESKHVAVIKDLVQVKSVFNSFGHLVFESLLLVAAFLV